ncbi:hypothetical protein [Peptostreptococcus faecalis]|uniref:hypothetical protein n=1 Tax=Peptostreptococcus faecalis TaxID=2045015 RepID=UPI000C7960C2|nr:hypothetical protein [Peptostreptococcus faecalis]
MKNKYVDWCRLVKEEELEENFIEENIEYLDINLAFKHQNLSDDFIKKYIHKVNCCELKYIKSKISEELFLSLISKMEDEMKTVTLYEVVNLTEPFMRKYESILDWKLLSRTQNMGEKFIYEFEDKIDWYELGEKQDFSEEFIIKNWDRLCTSTIAETQKISRDIILKFEDDWDSFDIESLLNNDRADFPLKESILSYISYACDMVSQDRW